MSRLAAILPPTPSADAAGLILRRAIETRARHVALMGGGLCGKSVLLAHLAACARTLGARAILLGRGDRYERFACCVDANTLTLDEALAGRDLPPGLTLVDAPPEEINARWGELAAWLTQTMQTPGRPTIACLDHDCVAFHVNIDDLMGHLPGEGLFIFTEQDTGSMEERAAEFLRDGNVVVQMQASSSAHAVRFASILLRAGRIREDELSAAARAGDTLANRSDRSGADAIVHAPGHSSERVTHVLSPLEYARLTDRPADLEALTALRGATRGNSEDAVSLFSNCIASTF